MFKLKKISDLSHYLNSKGIEEGVFSDGEDKFFLSDYGLPLRR